MAAFAAPAPLPGHLDPVRSPPIVVDLSDVEAMRRAFILKTVLDRPLSLRPRQNIGD